MAFGRDLDGCATCMKYSLFFSNFVIFIGGLVVVGIGSWTLVQKAFATKLLGTNLFLGAVYILIATGVVVIIISSLGCLGAIKEIKCMLLLYFIVVFIIFVTMLVGGILGYVFKDKVQYTMEQEMNNALRNYGSKREITDAWDSTQSTLRCCGLKGPQDWKQYTGLSVPESCCKVGYDNRRQLCQSYQTEANTYMRGCLDVTTYFIQNHATIIGGAGIGVACLMLLGMIFSCALFMSIE